MLDKALTAVSTEPDWRSVLDELPAPIYTTDGEGAVTYWNRACIDFAGRVPELGRGPLVRDLADLHHRRRVHAARPLPDGRGHQDRREVRGKVAIALRPDGSRIAFRPYPTPLFDNDGAFTGAINLLVDVSDEQADALTAQADRCRRLADATFNREVSDMLGTMAGRLSAQRRRALERPLAVLVL